MFDAADYFSNLESLDDLDRSARKPAVEAPRFPCQSCAGTGRYRGVRTQQQESRCFACNGVGSFATSAGDRMKARAATAARKVRVADAARAAFVEANPGLVEFLKANQWSDFLRSALAEIEKKGAIGDNFLAAVRSTQAKVTARDEARKAERAAEQSTRTVPVDLSPIHAMFDKAKGAGLKRLAYRAEGLVLSLAKAGSANPGAIYVKTKAGEYLGKVVGTAFQATREATDEHKAALGLIAANPAEAATAYGKKTGECACCGRELTDPASIAAGIGPICAEKWGF